MSNPRRTKVSIKYGYSELTAGSIEDTLITPKKAEKQKKTQKKTETKKGGVTDKAPALIIRPTKDMSFANF